MIRIEIEAPTYELLLVKVAEAVGITISGKVLSDGPPVSKPVTYTAPWNPDEARERVDAQVLKDGPHVGRHAIDVVAEQAASADAKFNVANGELDAVEQVAAVAANAFTAPAIVEPPRHGRPRKQQNAQPAVAENTGSTAAAELPVPEQASTSVAGEAVPAAAPVTPSISGGVAPNYTAEQVRAKLQEFLVTPGGDRGLQLAGDVLGQFGLAKVKQVNDNPQHFAGIVAAVDAELAKLAVAK